jgi:hypothetical protein
MEILPDDDLASARGHARNLLAVHESAVFAELFLDERRMSRIRRPRDGLKYSHQDAARAGGEQAVLT